MTKPLKISDDTSVEAKIRIQPDGREELTVSTGWINLGDLIDLLMRLRNEQETDKDPGA